MKTTWDNAWNTTSPLKKVEEVCLAVELMASCNYKSDPNSDKSLNPFQLLKIKRTPQFDSAGLHARARHSL